MVNKAIRAVFLISPSSWLLKDLFGLSWLVESWHYLWSDRLRCKTTNWRAVVVVVAAAAAAAGPAAIHLTVCRCWSLHGGTCPTVLGCGVGRAGFCVCRARCIACSCTSKKKKKQQPTNIKLSCAVLFSSPPKNTIIDLIADGDDAIKVQSVMLSRLLACPCLPLQSPQLRCKGDRDLLQQGTKGGEVMMFS